MGKEKTLMEEIKEKANPKRVLSREGMYSQFLRNRLGNYLVYVMYKLRILSTSQFTMMGSCAEILGSIVFAFGYYIPGFLLWFFGEVVDHADGTYARMLNKTKGYELRCHFVCDWHHRIAPLFVLIAGFLNYYLNTQNPLALWGALVTGVSFALTNHVVLLRNALLFQYKPKEASKQYMISDLYSSWKKTIFRLVWVLPVIKMHYIITIMFLIKPLQVYFVIFYAIYIPIRFLVFYPYSYLYLKGVETGK